MCCRIFRCLGWILDILQRVITFVLACILCFALCCGFVIALGAGIAYGYNISVVEYLDLKQADIKVYVRRGQFGDKPAFSPNSRRSGGDEPDLFSSNYTVDYQEQMLVDKTRPLSDAWQKAQDTSNYADKLTKYSKMKSNIMRTLPQDIDDDSGDMIPKEPFSEDVPSFVNSVRFVSDQTSSSSEPPKMRNFLPDYRPPYSQPHDSINGETRRSERKQKHKKKKPDIRIEIDDGKSLYLQPNASKFLYRQEDFEDADVEIYKKPI